MNLAKHAEYSHWESPLDLEQVFAKPSSPSYLQAINGTVYWMESLSLEKGRTVIRCRYKNGETLTLTPKHYHVRTQANEYGGRAFLVGSDALYFCNFIDQKIYRQNLSNHSDIVAVTDGLDTYYADLALTADERFLLFVIEVKALPENRTSIASIDLSNNWPQSPKTLIAGGDFYAGLTVSSNNQLAWLEWNHPNMPWDAVSCKTATLIMSDIDNSNLENLAIENPQTVVTGHGTAAHCYWAADESLYLTYDQPNTASDSADNFANLYCYDSRRANHRRGSTNQTQPEQPLKSSTAKLARLSAELGDYSYPHWIFGNQRYCQLGRSKIVAIFTDNYGDQLHLIDLETGQRERIATEYCYFNHICSEPLVYKEQPDETLLFAYVVAAKTTDQGAVLQISEQGNIVALSDLEENQQASYPRQLTSQAKLLEIKPATFTIEINKSYAYYYPPVNPAYECAKQLPPLLVMVHGGPTARAYPNFDVMKQFWTSSGFAVLDINHRGSSGFGRHYRDALLGGWGQVDAEDIQHAINQVVSDGLANPNNVFIRGKSAGGYAVQRALTLYPHVFAAGASYYGIGDLATLADMTHKFESHYTDRLLGEVYSKHTSQQPSSLYYQRSPINHIDQLECPMIVFQGGQDKVVPALLAEQIVAALKNKKIPCDYHLYSEEGHGFRSKDVLVDSLTKELAFYRRFMK